MGLIERIDRAIYRRITRGWPKGGADQYLQSLRVLRGRSENLNVVARTFEGLDAKAAALLTHTSMMIAALGISVSVVAGTQIEQAVIIVEIMGYLVISILCLRCISVFHEPPEFDDTMLSTAARDELIVRRSVYRFCNRATIYLTLIVLISLPILFLT